MTPSEHNHQHLFVAPPSAEEIDDRKESFDGSVEAMRRLRHPFAVSATDQPAPDDGNQAEPSQP
jgi:hypothetical protein